MPGKQRDGWRTRLPLAAVLVTLALLINVAVMYLVHGDPALATPHVDLSGIQQEERDSRSAA